MNEALKKTALLERTELSVDVLFPNPLNPNKMSDGEFNKLCDNISRLGFTDPVLVKDIGEGKFRIIGGHHRLEAAKSLGFKTVPVVINRDPDFDEDQENFQLVRHNVIRGKLSPKMFLELYKKYATKYPDDVLQDAFGFAEKLEFEKLIQQTKNGLPKELKAKFAEAAKELKTIDQLAQLLNKLFTQYGQTLKHNYMVFDYQGKESVWIRCQPQHLKDMYVLGDMCFELGVSLDQVIHLLLKKGATDSLLKSEIAQLPKNVEKLAKSPLPLVDELNNK